MSIRHLRHILALQLFALSAYALYCLALLLLDRDIVVDDPLIMSIHD